jgi:hypothetical protein
LPVTIAAEADAAPAAQKAMAATKQPSVKNLGTPRATVQSAHGSVNRFREVP